MTEPLLLPLESLINAYLRLDEAALSHLEKLTGKVFKLEIEDWNIVLFILPTSRGIQLRREINEAPTTTIRGKLKGLLKLSLAQGSHAALFENKIEVDGNLNDAETLRYIFTEIEIDWEEHLSKYMGDIAAHKVGTAASALKRTFQKTRQTLELNFKDFLQLEANLLPCQKEVTHFLEAVTQLRNDVERLEARLHRLQQHRESGGP